MKKQRRIIVIGGGASGLTAAVFAARKGAHVTVLEHSSRFGNKILASGNGRCNLGNENIPEGKYHGSDPAFAEAVLSRFPLPSLQAYFESIGILIKADRNGWLYPRSERAQNVLTQLLDALAELSVVLKSNACVTSVLRDDGQWVVETGDWSYEADAVILACGSSASLKPDPKLFSFLSELPHTVIPAYPALVPLYAKDGAPHLWDGVRIHGKAVLHNAAGNSLKESSGQLQLTAEGVSGIPAFDLSCVASPCMRRGERLFLSLDFLPDLTESECCQLLTAQAARFPKRSPAALLSAFFPEGLAKVLSADITDLRSLAACCKSFPLKLSGTAGLRKAQVAGGGIDPREIDPNRCASKLLPDLYICGEAIDVYGECGGWNLMFAWGSGALAGKAAAEDIR